MLYKTTTRLFRGTYQYKVVLICACASWFRYCDMDSTLEELKKVDINKLVGKVYDQWNRGIKTQEDLDYAFKLHDTFTKIKDIEVRVEHPWLSVYTNNKKDIDALVKLDPERIKYISKPPENALLAENTIIMPKMQFDYRITLGKTTQNHSTFVSWATNNKNLRLTKSCQKELNKDKSWGGTHFYLSGDNNLLMAKMHLGGCISKVERIINIKA